MMNFNQEFLELLNSNPKDKESVAELLENEFIDTPRKRVENLLIENIVFFRNNYHNVDFCNCRFSNCLFQNANFLGCQYNECVFENCSLNDCIFGGCELSHTNLVSCEIARISIVNGSVEYCSFLDCKNIVALELNFFCKELIFFQCNFRRFGIERIFNFDIEIKTIVFEKCTISDSLFRHTNFFHSNIINCTINSSFFVDVTFDGSVFKGVNTATMGQFSSIDFGSLMKSEVIPGHILKQLFGITSPGIQSAIAQMTSAIEYHTVFISFSFQDLSFAKLLDNELNKVGVKTFLWAKDAPGGQRLKTIMYNNIQKFDKILFIASESSLKSPACHFELSEGKKKFERTWKEVLFPIYIDNYLFSIKEHEIPRSQRVLFYDNISELIEINCKDFSQFVKAPFDSKNFSNAVWALADDLKKTR